jgi:AraC-like DNA-binding protein
MRLAPGVRHRPDADARRRTPSPQQLVEAPGQALEIVAPAMLAGPIGAEVELGEVGGSAAEAIRQQLLRSLPSAMSASVPIAKDRYDGAIQQGATPGEAAALVAQHAPMDIAANLAPIAGSAETMLGRAAQGAAAQGTLSAASQYAETGHVDPGDVAIAAGMGGALATTHVEPRTQSAADVAAAREGFASEKDAAAQTSAQGQAEGRFAKVLDAIGDDPEAKARADWVLAQHNEGGRSALWTAAQLKQIAETGKVGDEEGYAAAQAAASPEAAEMGVTPASAAAERTSEEEAGQEVFGQRGGDAPPEGHELRFSLDSHAESGMPDRSRPVSEVEQLPALERPSVDHTDAEPIADVGRAYHEIAQEPSTHQLPPVPPDAKTLADITEAVAPDFRVRQIENADGNGLLYQIETPGPRGMKPVWLKVEPGGRLQLDAGRLTEGSGNGSRIYHIVNEFAHRNRLTAAPDDAGLSEVNTFRRTEQQLASAARTRDTSHLIPDYTQRLTGWKPGRPTRDNTRAESEFNTGLLAHRAMENAHEAVPDLDRMRYNFDNERYEWSDGQPVSAHDFARLAGSDSARASGVGSSSIKRAVYTASLLRERGQGRRPDVLAQASRERLAAGWRGAGNVAPDRLLYRLGEGDGERSAPIGGGEAHPVPEGGADGERVPEAEGSGSARGDGVAGELPPGEGAGVEDAARVDEAGAPVGGEKQPSLAQIQAGNYRKDHVRALGLDVTIENPRGSTRSGTGPDGRSWSRTLNHHYGYIRGTLGADGDHLDTFLGDQPDNPTRQVFVIDQHKPEGGFDEHKVMLGFRNQRAAEQAYASEYPKGWQGMGRVRAMSAPEFKTWLKGAGREEAHTGPVADNVPRVTLRHQQPDASVVHASAPVEGTSAIAARGDMPRLGLDNAGLPSQRRAVFDEVPRSGNVPDGHSSAVLRNVYDLNADPRKLMDRARAEVEKRGLPLDADHVINEFERQVVANGFDGYRSEGKVAVLGHDVPVARSEHEQHLPENENTDRGPAAPEGAVSEREGAGAAGRDGESGESDQGASADGERGEAGQGAVRPLSEQPAPREKVAYSGKGMSKSAAQGLVKLLKWDRSGDRIQVHQSIGDVPAELRNRIEPGFRDKVHGFYDPKTGTAHVIADKMTTPKELYRTLTEEHLGHGGLRKVFNTRDLNEMLDRAWGSVPKDERAAIARDYELDASKPEHRREIAEEYLAKLEPDGRSKTTFEKFRDWFNSTSRKMGRDVDYSPSELRAIMAAAHDHQRAGLSPSLHSRSAVDLVTPRNGLDGGYKMGKDGPEVDALKMRVARQKGTAEQEESMARTMATPHEDLSLGDRARAWLAGLKATGWEGAKDAWHGSLQGWLDAGNQVKRIEHSIFGGFLADASESPYKMYNLAKNSHAVMAAVMKLGVPEYRDGAFQPTAGRKGVFEIFRPLYEHQSGKSLMPLWEFYASAKRASRLINEKNINGDSRENNFSQQDIDRGLALEKQYPEFKTVADNFDTFNKQLLDLAADRGAISPEEAAAWKAHFYVPFMRAVEDVELAKAPKNLRGSAASNQKIYSRRLTGSENKVDSVFENILANTSYMIDRTYRQEFMNRLLDMGEGVVLHKVPLANRAVHITNEDLARALWKGGVLSGTPTQGAHASANDDAALGHVRGRQDDRRPAQAVDDDLRARGPARPRRRADHARRVDELLPRQILCCCGRSARWGTIPSGKSSRCSAPRSALLRGASRKTRASWPRRGSAMRSSTGSDRTRRSRPSSTA